MKYFSKFYHNNGKAVGIVRVMYGYRIQAGYTKGDEEPSILEINWCCGTDRGAISLAYAVIKHIVDDPNTNFYNMPLASDIKPYQNDQEFMNYVLGLVTSRNITKIEKITDKEVQLADQLMIQGIDHELAQ